jgi:hypothetical protein
MPRYLKSSTQSPVSPMTSPSNTGSTIPLIILESALCVWLGTTLLVSTLTKWPTETLGNGSRVLEDSKLLMMLALFCVLSLQLTRIAMLYILIICPLVARFEATWGALRLQDRGIKDDSSIALTSRQICNFIASRRQ